jgi:predicted CXXCH cytochrome family protein
MKRILVFSSIFFIFYLALSAQNKARGNSEFVGSEVCKACHEAKYNEFIMSIHGKKAIPGTPVNQEGCESCHGPGAQHVEKGGGRGVAIFAFNRKESADSRAAKCIACHEDMQGVENWDMSMHKTAGISCDRCHSIHEKRGPYAYEHPPVPENCLNCHEIHGSNHTKLLVRKVPLLCQSCHDLPAHPSQPYTNLHSFSGPATSTKNKFFGRSCLNCHGNIHGSSLSEFFVR